MQAQKSSSAKLMVAYRLHFGPATLDLIGKIRDGELGTVHLFSSVFAQMGDPANHRAANGEPLEPFERVKRIDPSAQREMLGAERSPDLVGVSNPAREQEKTPKN